ncbi:hypothetical protein K435DRAFT_802481 [Dendrothele bispora CBS 962.96]|uniref:N-acetyltransferase domain-containing protein n=1 Tax=Dendrothele bispora (strain CBS 962.96) TaxID=1314807 RepID=A0A4S8LL91_DENBC|nr:hypothetical protein K435DRAFT_802481 [Dendrothele bispora CBS 962.96]
MPSQYSSSVNVYHHASDLPPEVITDFEKHPVTYNTIYPHVLKCKNLEAQGLSIQDGQMWIVITSYTSEICIDFVLSCTETRMGKYPIFIVTSRPLSVLSDDFIAPRLNLLIEELRHDVDDRRIYSVFAQDNVARWFARLWTESTGIDSYREPYYAAKLSFCTPSTFINRSSTTHPSLTFIVRPAVEDDRCAVAQLCHGFASESEPFVLDEQRALDEATDLIRNNIIWVHEVLHPERGTEIASLVAFTRNSDAVATITKVYTNPNSRGLGCAQRLVRRVCKHLLQSHDKVALYVAHNNPAASRVYHRVGFIGLDPEIRHIPEGVEFWTEYGFDRGRVDLGHW